MTALPAPVRDVCTTFLSEVPDGLVTGLYLHGGLAFGEWVAGRSDVDFTATLARVPGVADLAALRSAHEIVAAKHGDGPVFDGVHVLTSDLLRPPEACPDRPTIFQHTFEAAGRFTLSPVSWHELARHGITVAGQPIDTVGVWTDDDALRAFTIDNLDTYWRGQVGRGGADPETASSDVACEWVVPGVARLHHLLVTRTQTAKSLAVRWGLGFYPERWHRVLRESLHLREGSFGPQYADHAERGRDVLAFATYVVDAGVSLRSA